MSQDLPQTTLVILGVSGDLSRRKLLPALAEICENSEVKAHLKILGVSRRPLDDSVLPPAAEELRQRLSLLQLDYGNEADYSRLKDALASAGSQQVIFYFAVPPAAVVGLVEQLGQAGLNGPQYKLLMEKPFGTDFESAQQLITRINHYYKEEQVYRIDHYLAKEPAQNISVFLGSNAIFRDVWSNQFVESIDVIAAESIGIEGRVQFWEATGTLRDFVQSHLMQLTALTLMEPCPDVTDFGMMQRRRLEVLQSLKLSAVQPVIKGQYRGYKEEVGNPESNTETFVSLVLESGLPKWHGVPIRLTTGKKLNDKLTEIRVHFRRSQSAQTNILKLRIQPDEAIELDLWVKQPGYEQHLQKLPLEFAYHQHFAKLPDAYEQVIVDAIRSRFNLFASGEEVLASWRALQPLLPDWPRRQPLIYEPGNSFEEILNADN